MPTPSTAAPSPTGRYAGTPLARVAGMLAAPILAASMLAIPAPAGMPPEAWRTAALGLWMAIWWITEAIPLAATALIPLALFPLAGLGTIEQAAAPYANSVIYLFMGGFMIATAFQRWGLHRRLAIAIVAALGTRPASVVLGILLATAVISMWVSNTATAMMMLPIGLSVIALLGDSEGEAQTRNFGVCVMLAIAYGATIGGLGTLIGTPPNALLAGFMNESFDRRVGFVQWMLVGVPLVVVSLPLTWLVLTRWFFPLGSEEIPGARAAIAEQRAALGPLSRAEKRLAVIVSLLAAAWVFQPLLSPLVPGLSDAGIAILAALALFLVPSGVPGKFLLDWETAAKQPWEVLVLFGGGLSLASAIGRSGLAEWIGGSMGGLGALPPIVLILAISLAVVFLTELTSNTATAATFLPVVGSVAVGMGIDPILLAAPAALAASCGFMMPVGTPPNAIVYGTGLVRMSDMARVGFVLNLMLIGAITAVSYFLMGVVF